MLHVPLRHRQVRRARRAGFVAAAALALAAPVASAQDAAVDAQAESLARSGRHLEAAARYEQLAHRGLLSWDASLAVLAAREYVAAGERDEAARMLDKARGRVRTQEELVGVAALDATLALDAGDPSRALATLRALPTPWPQDAAAELLALRGRAEAALGRPLDAVRTFEERSVQLPDAAARAANDRALLDLLVLHPPGPGLALAGASERELGWLEVPGLASMLGRAPASGDASAARALQDWIARHPQHPATAFLPRAGIALPGAVAAGSGTRIALLLPLTGRQQSAGAAVRDGFVAGWWGAGGEARPQLEVYDTASGGAAAAYRKAIAEGARLVVGPLVREDVAALVAAEPAGLSVPTLALNGAPAGTLPAFLFQFALDPEQEARAVARRIADDGWVRGVALFPDTAWGERVRAAFVAEIETGGRVTLTSTATYPTGAKDYSAPLRAALGRFGGAGDRFENRPAPVRNPAAERAAGPQFVFVAASPAVARALKPQLRFQMTYDVPLYSTSDAWEPSVRSASDMDGLVFPEMPWLLYGGQGAPELWDVVQEEWQARARGRLRLYAFGYDAFRLSQQLGSGGSYVGVDGLTGQLELARDDGRVRRTLQFARIEQGRPQPAAPGAGAYIEPSVTNPPVAPDRP